MTTSAQYPIGKFSKPSSLSPQERNNMIQTIAQLPTKLSLAIADYSDDQLNTPYRDGGWTVRQVIHHLADSHMNSFMRFKLALTEESPVIKPYFEAKWAEMPDASTAEIISSIQILEGVHLRWVVLMQAMKEDDWQKEFVHPEHGKTFSLETALALYAWHSEHHLGHIKLVG